MIRSVILVHLCCMLMCNHVTGNDVLTDPIDPIDNGVSIILSKPLTKRDNRYKTEDTQMESDDNIKVNNDKANDTTETAHERSLIISGLSQGENASYICQPKSDNQSVAIVELVESQTPQITIDRVELMSLHSAKLHWHVINGENGNTERLVLQFMNYSSINSNASEWTIIDDKIEPQSNGTVTITNLTQMATYGFRMSIVNCFGESKPALFNITMMPQVPAQITDLRILATTNETLLVGWKRPHDYDAQIIDYQMELQNTKDSTIAEENMNIKNNSPKIRNNYMYVFVGLQPATKYLFRVRGCSNLGCGNWSQPMLEAFTSDGHADAPKHVKITCYYDTTKYVNYALISWSPTDNPRGTVMGYNVTLFGTARYRNSNNQFETDNFADSYRISNNDTHELSAIPLIPNSNYTVSVCVINLGGCGAWSVNDTDDTRCSLPPSPPNVLPAFKFERTNDLGQLKLTFPRISERLGLITCYRVYLIRLPKGVNVIDLPKDTSILNVTSYSHVHYNDINADFGVYIADEINSDNDTQEVIIGDGKYSTCKYNTNKYPKENLYKNPNVWAKRVTNTSLSSREAEKIEDGPLQEFTNYSGFVEIQVLGSNSIILRKHSSYLPVMLSSQSLMTVPNPTVSDSPLLSSIASPITTIILCVVSGFALILLIVLLILLIRRGFGVAQRNTHAEDGQMPVPKGKTNLSNHNTKTNGFLSQKHNSNINSSQFANPIYLSDLLHEYKERHANNDRLFEYEFNSLPLEFSDRTSNICELEVNRDKNRFSSIKCYDLTRVRLSLIDQLHPNASDYINANFISINDKLYICTQGPLESTLSEFWRMIYEYECSVIVMLTSCEEQGRVKCAQYWPEEGCKTVKPYTIQVRNIHNYSDYTVRRFNLTTDNHKDSREILQFHFTLWHDFSTPELSSRILRFIKHVNENYCNDKGPLVVHCCAGVGRAGTYIAIDSLLLDTNSGFINIYDRISNLRHQRYNMVQNLKQYIFIYRVILEISIFGDTEMDIDHYRDYYYQLFESKMNNVNIPLEQFEKLHLTFDAPKTCDFGSKNENLNKNRSNTVIPYDLNRMILPSNNNEESVYINASLIKGYDQQLSFIICQDPMENTINEFWSMIYENDVNQLVMLSHTDSTQRQCFRYWPNEEISLKNYSVKLIEQNNSHSKCDYFVKRRFEIVKHASVIETPHIVVQYQFLSWHANHIVPESAIPLIVLCEQILSFHESHIPIVIHCHDGAQRSGVCLSLITLLQQIKVDKRVDVFQTARYTSVQRQGMFQTIDQYSFLYRGIMNYLKHRNLCDTSDVVL